MQIIHPVKGLYLKYVKNSDNSLIKRQRSQLQRWQRIYLSEEDT